MSEAPYTSGGPPAQTVLRIFVFLFGLAGGLSGGWLGYKWYSDMDKPEVKAGLELAVLMKDVDPKAKEMLAEHERLSLGSYLLMATLPVGIIAGLVGFLRIVPIIAALLMLAALAAPAIAEPRAIIFTSPFAIGALLASRVKTK